MQTFQGQKDIWSCSSTELANLLEVNRSGIFLWWYPLILSTNTFWERMLSQILRDELVDINAVLYKSSSAFMYLFAELFIFFTNPPLIEIIS